MAITDKPRKRILGVRNRDFGDEKSTTLRVRWCGFETGLSIVTRHDRLFTDRSRLRDCRAYLGCRASGLTKPELKARRVYLAALALDGQLWFQSNQKRALSSYVRWMRRGELFVNLWLSLQALASASIRGLTIWLETSRLNQRPVCGCLAGRQRIVCCS